MIVNAWVITFSATIITSGGLASASSLPHSWPTEEACNAEAVQAEQYIKEMRPDLTNVEVRCVPHRKLVDEN